MLKAFPLRLRVRRSMIPALTTSRYTESLCKICKDWKGRSKMVSLQNRYNFVGRNFGRFHRKLIRIIK